MVMSVDMDMANYAADLGHEGMPEVTQQRPEEGFETHPIPRISVQGFCLTDQTTRTVEAAAEDRRMTKAHVKVHMGGIPAAIEHYTQAPTPNLIIVETSGNQGEILVELDQLAEFCDAGTKVIVIGDVNDVTLYRELMHRGVSEYLITPLDIYHLIRAIGDLYGDPQSEPLGRTVAFFGVKGDAEHRPSLTTQPGHWLGNTRTKPLSPTLIWPSGQQVSTTIRIRCRASMKQSRHRNGWTRPSSTVFCRNAPNT